MDELRHSDWLRLQVARPGAPTRFCPEDQLIAEYYDGALGEMEADTLERHLASCRFCRTRIGVLGRLAEETVTRRIPGEVLARAKQFAPPSRPRRRVAAPILAAAAVLVAALSMTLMQPWGTRPGTIPATGVSAPADRQLRSVGNLSSLEMLYPATDGRIDPQRPFQWSRVPDRLYYELSVLSESGDILASERLQETEWRPDDALVLQPGQTYYVQVVATLPNGRTLRSEHLGFQVGEEY